jgi:hypothetical protein
MKRYLIAGLVVVGPLAAVAPAAVPRAQLRSYVCQTARDPANRGVSITAVMRPMRHTVRLALRFDLLVRARHSSRIQAVHYGDLGKWIYPADKTLGQRPGDIWKVNHPVAQLSLAPAYYRFRVSFRWIGAHNRVLGTAVRSSPPCFQPELRPDLVVSAVRVAAQYAKHDLYKALIRNAGASSTDQPVEVEITGGRKPKTIAALGAHSKRWVFIPGPLCNPVAPPSVTVDPSGVIDESNYTDNSLVATCPGP